MDQSHRSHEIRIRIDQLEKLLMFDYDPDHEDALYDILDPEGRIVKTGDVSGPVTRVRITDLQGGDYVLMVLDGDTSTELPIHLRRAS